MRARRTKPILIFFAMLVVLMVPATVVAQQVPLGSAEVNELYVHPSTTQAGGHPDVHLFFRFCDPIPHIINATNTSPIVITTLEPHGLADNASISVRGVWGNLAANAGSVAPARAHVTGPNTFELQTSLGAPIAGNGQYAGGGWVSAAPTFGCVHSPSANEVQTVTVDATGGTFKLSFNGSQTSAIAENAAAAAVRAALEALPSIGVGNVTVTGPAGGPYAVTFISSLASADQPMMTTDATLLTGGASTATVVETTPGLAPVKQQDAMQLRRFLLQLPPGFLGNPEVVGICPADTWVTSDNRNALEGCPFTTQVGHSNTRTITKPFDNAAPVNAPTPLYRVPNNGLEPARLGTDRLFGDPPGPVPVQIRLRSSGDYGLNSAVIDLPKNLGGPQAAIQEIETVLCGYAPCRVPSSADFQQFLFNFEQPVTVTPLAGARPFFVNPTSCQPAISRLDAASWLHPEVVATKTSTDVVNNQVVPSFTPTGCENVPFDAHVSLTPTKLDNGNIVPDAQPQVGVGQAQQVAIDYCNPAPPVRTPPSCVNHKDFADDQIWESALRHADVKLPEGMTLSPGGGNGLEGCDFQQFGVNAQGKQINDDPPTCPAGAQVGTITTSTPVLPDGALSGKVFFGCDRTSNDPPQPCLGTPGRPTLDHPWKLFLYIEGAGLRIKLVGNVDVSETGQIHNVFLDQPQVPFTRLEINLRGGDRSILANPDDCNKHDGSAHLTGWADMPSLNPHKTTDSTPTITPNGCVDPKPFAPSIDSAGSDPEQAGANTTSHIVISRQDGQDDIKTLKLSLPVGAVGSLSAVPQCAIADAQAGNCSDASKVGTVRTTVGTGTSLLETSGSLYLAEPSAPNEAATLALVVPAKVGPIDLGRVVVLNHVSLRASDTGIDTVTSEIPNILGGVPLHVRKIEITVDRPGFFINPTGCDPRPLTATFNSYGGQTSTSTMMLNAKGCENLSFAPKLRLIAGAKGQNAQFSHPPLTAIVTQGPGEANIKNSQVILPDLLRPNAAQFNVPGGLCSDAQFAQRACPALSLAGSARVITPVLPFQLSGPVYVVQEIGSVLPKLYVVLQGRGIEVVLRARNSFLHAIQTVNNFDGLPDVPQSYFELKIRGGPGGILNNFYDACGIGNSHRKYDYTFTGQNGKTVKQSALLEQAGCARASSLDVSIASSRIKVSRKGIGKLKIRCVGGGACRGKVTVKGKGVTASGRFSIGRHKAKSIKLKFSKGEVKKIHKKKRLKSKAAAKLGNKTITKRVVLVYSRK